MNSTKVPSEIIEKIYDKKNKFMSKYNFEPSNVVIPKKYKKEFEEYLESKINKSITILDMTGTFLDVDEVEVTGVRELNGGAGLQGGEILIV